VKISSFKNKLTTKNNINSFILTFLALIIPLTATPLNKTDSLKSSLAKTKKDSSIIETKLKISKQYHRQNIHTEDIIVATQAVESALLTNDTYLYAQALMNLAMLYFRKKDFTNSLSNFEESLSLVIELKNKRLIMKNAEMISQIYEELADSKKALFYYKISRDYKDSINLSEQQTEIAAIKNRYNFDKKESKIELLIKDKSIQNSRLAINHVKLRNRSTIIFFMSLSLFSLILLALLQHRNRKIRLKTEKQLQQQEREKIQAVYEKNLMEAEMLATRMQVNPHFLFNCLNSIKYMIQSNQNKQAIEYLVIFSRLIRMVLETSHKPLSTICEELELIRYYLKLEGNRFNDDFSFTIENKLKEDLKNTVLPTLILQPFVENAIWHGLLPSDNPIKLICLIVNTHPKGVQIIIDDNGVGRKKAKTNQKHNSMGNKITYERIQLFNKSYPNYIQCDIIDKVDPLGNSLGTRVSLLIHKETESIKSKKGFLAQNLN
jgi:sensor histidine kinase YesM